MSPEEEKIEVAEEEEAPVDPIESDDSSDLSGSDPQGEPPVEETPVETPVEEPKVEEAKEETPVETPAEEPKAEGPKVEEPAEEETKAPEPMVELDKHPMRRIVIEKVVVNIGVGEGGEKLIRGEKVIEMVTGRKSARTISNTTNKDLGLRKEMPIGCKVTLRGPDAEKFLKDAFWVKENKLAGYSFDTEGNFSFGIPDYTDFPGMKYDPDIGIFGMDISVVLSRPGKRVSIRRHAKAKIPHTHKVSRGEAKSFLVDRFNVEVVE